MRRDSVMGLSTHIQAVYKKRFLGQAVAGVKGFIGWNASITA